MGATVREVNGDNANRNAISVGRYIYDSDIVSTRYLIVATDSLNDNTGWNIVDLSDGSFVFDGEGVSRDTIRKWIDDDSARRLMASGEAFTIVVD